MVKRCILLSCPCPHVRSISSCYLQPRFRHCQACSAPRCVPMWRCRPIASAITFPRWPHAAYLPRVCGPFDVYLQAQRPALQLGFRFTFTRAGFTSPAPLRPRSFALPRRFIPLPAARPCFVPVPSLGFHTFGGFSPPVAPWSSRSPVSSLPFLRLRGRGFEDVSIGRTRCCRSRD